MGSVQDEILALERSALDRWIQGDPMGFVERAGEEITYCEPFLPGRLQGREAFVAHMASIQGLVRADRYELLDPVFYGSSHIIVLSFQFLSWVGDRSDPWMATSVYQRGSDGWRQVHAHWSQPARS